jgi:hypothetical protein
MNRRETLVGALSVALAGGITACQLPPIAYMASASGVAPAAAKDPACAFAVTATIPSGEYEEVGTLTYGSRTLSSFRASRDPEEFRRAVQSDVCKLGGDVVVTELDRQGTIVRGSVLRRKL